MGCCTTSAQVCWILFCKLDFYSANTQQSHSWMAFVCMCKCATGEDLLGLLRMTQSSPSIFEKGGHSTSSQLQYANKDNKSLLYIVIACYTCCLHMAAFLTMSCQRSCSATPILQTLEQKVAHKYLKQVVATPAPSYSLKTKTIRACYILFYHDCTW